MKDKILKLTASVLVLALLTLTFASGIGKTDENTVKAATAELDGHKNIAANEDYTLYVDEDTLSLIIEDNKTGATMSSSITYAVTSISKRAAIPSHVTALWPVSIPS